MFLLALVACNDSKIGIRNDPPSVAFTAPAPSDTLLAGAPLELVAQVVDAQQASSTLTLLWSSSRSGTLTAETIVDDDADEVRLLLPDGLEEGEETITLRAIDELGDDDVDSLALTVLPNTPPSVRFVEPTDGAVLSDAQALTLRVHVEDAEHAAETLSLAWEGAGVGLPDAPNADGEVAIGLGALAPGAYSFGITATDPLGASSSAAVAVEVVPADADGDGYADVVWGGEDCDDTDPGIHPDADEVCDGIDQDCDGVVDEDALDASVWFADADSDLYGDARAAIAACEAPAGTVADATDCDDLDGAVNPGALEVCNGIDDDCDGTVDEDDAVDALTWYVDADTDGFGSVARSVRACDPPVGTGAVAGDCDDADAAVNPAAPEVCNATDDDCDGAVDESDAVDASTWYTDADGDAYGDPSTAARACEAPAGAVADATDCDDTDDDVSPAALEACNGIDDDCDGDVDEDSATDASIWYRDVDADGWGDEAFVYAACDSPAGYSGRPGDCDDGEATTHPGMAEVCDDGRDNDCDGGSNGCEPGGIFGEADADAKILGLATSDEAGTSASIVSDFDGDGYGELLVGAPLYDGVGSNSGGAWLLDGRMSGTLSLSTAAVRLDATLANDWAGDFVRGVRDMDGDGLGELLVGATYNDDGAANAGAVYLFYGRTSGLGSVTDLADADLEIVGGAGDLLSLADSIGDYDGDGIPDIAAGSWVDDAGGANAGAAYIVPGGTFGVRYASAYTTFLGAAGGDAAGGAIAGGDLDGDGLSELVVGAPLWGARDDGAVYIVAGATASVGLASADVILTGELSLDRAGSAVAVPGDLDGDGLLDLAVGAPLYSGYNVGSLYLYSGMPASGVLSSADVIVRGAAGADAFAASISGAGDLNGDGTADLAVGAYGASVGGAVHVFYGPVDATSSAAADVRFDAGSAGDGAGYTIGNSGDLNGDGFDDLVMGAYGDDEAASSAGAVLVLFGGGL